MNKPRRASEKFIWAFPIESHWSWQQDLADNLNSVDMAILTQHDDDRPPYYSFSSPHLNHLPPAQAQGRAQALLTLLNGLLAIQNGPRYHPFTLSKCIDLRTGGHVPVNYFDVPTMEPFPEDHECLRYLDRPTTRLSSNGKIIFVARYDVHVKYLMQIFGAQGINFVTLYKALDTMNDAGFTEKQLAMLLVDTEKRRDKEGKLADAQQVTQRIKEIEDGIKAFRFNANKFQGGGLDSRHGFEAVAVSSKQPILTIQNAAEIMLPIINAFISLRVTEQFTQRWSSVQFKSTETTGPALEPYKEF